MQEFPPNAKILGLPKRLDHFPLVSEVFKKLDFAQIIDDRVPEHPSRETSTGTCVEALILTILSGTHTLSGVSNFLEDYDLDLLLGSPTKSSQLNDDRLGRALDAIYKAGVSPIYTAAMLRAVKAYQLDLGLLHFDTTSLSVHGDYTDFDLGDPENPDAAPAITYGFSKDKRPDLKQVLYGLTVTHKDGVPIMGRVTDGSRSDSRESAFTLKQLAEVLPDPRNTTLVADSKMFSGKNLLLAKEVGINVVTVLPRTTELWSTVFETLRPKLKTAPCLRQRVKSLFQIDEQGIKGPVIEQQLLESWTGLSTEEIYHFRDHESKTETPIDLNALLITSTELTKSKEKSLRKKLTKEQERFKKHSEKAGKQDYECEQDAQRALDKLVKLKTQFHTLTGRVNSHEIKQKREKAGRPKAGEEIHSKTVWRVLLSVSYDEGKAMEFLARECCFIVVWLAGFELSDEEALRIYKGQSTVEGSMRWAKCVANVAPIYLKTPRRIAALGMVYVLALMVRTLLQRTVRAKLQEEKKTIPGNVGQGRTDKPTAEVIFRLFSNTISIGLELEDGQRVKYLGNITTEKAAVFDLIESDFLRREGTHTIIREPKGAERGRKPMPCVIRKTGGKRKTSKRRKSEISCVTIRPDD
jgi:transposase